MTVELIEATMPDWLVDVSEGPRDPQLVADKDRGQDTGLVPGMSVAFVVGRPAVALIDGKVSFEVDDRDPAEKPNQGAADDHWRVFTTIRVKLDGRTIWKGGENWHVKDHYRIANFSRQVAVEPGPHKLEVFAIYARKGGAGLKNTRVYFKARGHHHLSMAVLEKAAP